jgi:predicted ATP-grasp superfamily ATP-dependent carboligase
VAIASASEMRRRDPSRENSTPDAPTLIVIGYSARALASSARRAGFAPLTIDVFGDSDLREISLASVTLEGGFPDGLTAAAVAPAVNALIREYDPVGLVYGAGIEHQPELIDAIADEIRVFGNGAQTLARAKDPEALARLCANNGVRHPNIAFSPPDRPEGWLIKRRGWAGGSHVQRWTCDREVPSDCYFQRELKGRSVSALFVADGAAASIVGLSAQWTAPTPRSPFRYGGAVGPVDTEPKRAHEIERAVDRLVRNLGLVGINSADFLVSDEAAWLIEINPRPPATLDVFDSDRDPLLAHHVAACDGRMTAPAARRAFKAAQIVYADCDSLLQSRAEWPDWTADRPMPGARVKAGDPLCTVIAAAESVEAARRLAGRRSGQINAPVGEWAR